MLDKIIRLNPEQILTWNNDLIRVGHSPSPPVDPWPTSGLVERWPLQFNLEGDNGYDLAALEDAAAFETGVVADTSALTLDNNKRYEIDNSTNIASTFFGTGSYSVSLWFYSQDGGNGQSIWSCGNDSDATGANYAHGWLHNTVGYPNLNTARKGAVAAATDVTGSYTSGKTWRHGVWTYENPDVVVYQDNAVKTYVGGTALNGYNNDVGSNLRYFGVNVGGVPMDVGGASYVYLYNRALTAAEVEILYNSGTPI